MLDNVALPKLNMNVPEPARPEYDLKEAVQGNKWLGFWRLMTGFHRIYLGATLSLGLAATANTATYLLLRYFIDDYLGAATPAVSLWLILSGFLGLALAQGFFTSRAGRWQRALPKGLLCGCATIYTTISSGCPFTFTTRTRRVNCSSGRRRMWTPSAGSLPTRSSRAGGCCCSS
jgi:hypothetical protein